MESPGHQEKETPQDRDVHSILRITLPYIISAQEYKVLHKHIISRSNTLQRNTPSILQAENVLNQPGRNLCIPTAIRDSLRLFLASQAGFATWADISRRIFGGGALKKGSERFWQLPSFKLSLSISSILFFHRLIYGLFTRLRARFLAPQGQHGFFLRKLLTSKFTPAVAASLAGILLRVYPVEELRVTVAIFFMCDAAQVTYNLAEHHGLIWKKEDDKVKRPWWFGSWLLFPVAFGQLFYTFVFDRECFPPGYGDFILKHSTDYIQPRPEGHFGDIAWPRAYEIVDNLAESARLEYPPFDLSAILDKVSFPPGLKAGSLVLSRADPKMSTLSCALLHPSTTDHIRAYFSHWTKTFPKLAKLFGMVFAALSIPQYKSFYNKPVSSFAGLASSILRMTAFVTGLIGTSWGSICLFQSILPRNCLATQRFFLSGFLAGLWAILMKDSGRDNFLYVARTSIESTWNVGKKRDWWKGGRNGEIALFVGSLAILNVVYTEDQEAIRSKFTEGLVSGLRSKCQEEERK